MPDILFSGSTQIVSLALSFLVAITIHEFSHALAADKLGDPTPRVQGRLTLNPLAHLDMIGSVLLPLFLLLSRSPILFGWAKPVQFDPFNLGNPRRDAAIISFAGPASNFSLAAILSLIVHGLLFFNVAAWEVVFFILPFIVINVVLGVFNLIPIHPLDGGKILVGLLPRDLADNWDRTLRQYGIIILLFLILPIFGDSLLMTFMSPTIRFVLNLLLPSLPII